MTTTRLSGPVRLATYVACAAVLLAACKSDEPADEQQRVDGSISPGTGIDDETLDGGAMREDGGANRDGGATSREDGGGASREGGQQQRPVQECPSSVPQNGSSCVSGRGDCTIGDTFCDCPSETSQWLCWKPSDCPTVAPAELSACSVVGMECEIASPDGGSSGGLDCECTAGGWDCGRQVCPATEPAVGGACESGSGICNYATDRICDCRGRTWACWSLSDCPATPPAVGAACPVQRMVCDYAGGDCECTAQGFTCQGQNRPRDGGVPDAASGEAGAGDASSGDDASANDAASTPDA